MSFSQNQSALSVIGHVIQRCHWRIVVLQALNRDVAEVNELLPEQDRLELLDMVQSNMTRQNKREV